MDILVRKKGEKEWKKVAERKFQDEAALQQILYESPDIIPIEKLGEQILKPKLFIKEAGLPGSGNTDLIGIDENGGITIVECKLAKNAEIRRKVIGQVLEYAAYLWQMDYEQFDGMCCKAEKWDTKHLIEAMQEKMREGKGWSTEDFRQNVVSTLEKGDFRLIIAVDALNDELRRIIQFLNSRGAGAPHIYAVEMSLFEAGELDMLVPELHGPPPPPPDGPMDEPKLLSLSSEICRRLYLRLKELAKGERFRHSGFTRRGFAFRYHPGRPIFVLYPNYLEMWIGQGYLDDLLDNETVREFYSRLFEIGVFDSKKDRKNTVVVVSNDTWKEQDVDTLLAAVEFLGSRLKQL